MRLCRNSGFVFRGWITTLALIGAGCQESKAPDPPGMQNHADTTELTEETPVKNPEATPSAPNEMNEPRLEKIRLESYSDLGPRSNTRLVDGVAVTEGVMRVRRRHENDMDFSKYNPFYWEGRVAHFTVEDFTTRGEKRLRFRLETEWPQDATVYRGPDFSAIYKGDPTAVSEALRSKFEINQRMNHVADHKQFEVNLGPEVFQSFPDHLKVGSMLIFEFRFFLDESNPLWKKQKDFNPHNLSAYYSEFLRIRVGEAGLLVDSFNNPTALPSVERFSGGWTTLPTTRVEPWKALQQQALNLSVAEAQNFLTGRTFFHSNFQDGLHVDDRDDDKPLVFFEEMRKERSGYAADAYNALSCNGCHVNNGIALLPDETQGEAALNHTLAKTQNRRTGEAHALFGNQLQTNGPAAEGKLKIKSYKKIPVTLADGTVITLRKPEFSIESARGASTDLGISIRKPPALIGMGLLEAIPEATLLALANQSKGEVVRVQGKIGRFGWKAQQTTVRDQIVAALNNDMGVSTEERPQLDCGSNCRPGKARLPKTAVDSMESYVSLLGVPPRLNPTDPIVKKGQQIFEQLNCQNCHVQVLKTGSSRFKELAQQTIQPFTDLLLHDMGEGLADDGFGPKAHQWRTAPLWGLKNVKHSTDSHMQRFAPGNILTVYTDTMKIADGNPIQFLHDGRAQSLAEAILWHGGQAQESVQRYKALTQADRLALEAYLWDL